MTYYDKACYASWPLSLVQDPTCIDPTCIDPACIDPACIFAHLILAHMCAYSMSESPVYSTARHCMYIRTSYVYSLTLYHIRTSYVYSLTLYHILTPCLSSHAFSTLPNLM